MSDSTLRMPSLFGDHMVLQQGMPVPVWGKGNPGEQVSVTLGDAQATTTVDTDGKWLVRLPKQTAGGPIEMVVRHCGEERVFADVLIGEVWLASGQSNMWWPLRETDHAQEDIADASYPDLRLCTIECAVAPEPKDDCNVTWNTCTPESAQGFSAVGFLFGRELRKALNCPIGIINSSWPGTPIEAWTSRATLEADPEYRRTIVEASDSVVADFPRVRAVYEEAMAQWQQASEQAKADGQPEPPQPAYDHATLADHWQVGRLFNAMIHPLIPFALQGAIWYQGESNAWHAWQYRRLFPTMIHDWRHAWGQGDFGFYFVQLANFNHTRPSPDPTPSQWAELREAQTIALQTVRHTGMAVAIDIGMDDDIHPRNKRDVAKRLALSALANTYRHQVSFAGPTVESVKIEDGKAIVSLIYAKGLNAKGGGVSGFTIAGADRCFHWADAVIDGETVVVSCAAVPKPVAVRYGWADNPTCNLYNEAGLPAVPFRTDDWPGMTMETRM